MKALLLTDHRKLELVDFPQPTVRPDEVLVQVAACGICGSDVHGYDGSTGRRIPPLIMGHEAAGHVAEVGPEVTRFRVGDRVTFDSTIYCGVCSYCQAGKINLCDYRQVLGVSCGDYLRHGAFAEFVAVPERVVYRLPDELPLTHAALIEAVSVAVHAVDRNSPRRGATAAVIGSGMIGLLVVQALRSAGVQRVVAVDLDDTRLALAKKLGAELTVNSANQDAIAAIRDFTQGHGSDCAYEVVGATESIATAVECVAKGAAVTLIGNLAPQVQLPLQSVVTRELTLYGSCASQGDYPQCIELMASGGIQVTELLSACAPLDEGPSWFERLYSREPGLMKVVLEP